jgi:hypothetical protein
MYCAAEIRQSSQYRRTSELLRDTDCWPVDFEMENKMRGNLHRSQLTASMRFALRLRIPGSLLISNTIQARLKPSAARPFPVILWQPCLVIVALIDRALAEDCFPSVHVMLLSRYSNLLYDAPEKGFFKGCPQKARRSLSAQRPQDGNFSATSVRQKSTEKPRFAAFFCARRRAHSGAVSRVSAARVRNL